jgi:hypothetical protein
MHFIVQWLLVCKLLVFGAEESRDAYAKHDVQLTSVRSRNRKLGISPVDLNAEEDDGSKSDSAISISKMS